MTPYLCLFSAAAADPRELNGPETSSWGRVSERDTAFVPRPHEWFCNVTGLATMTARGVPRSGSLGLTDGESERRAGIFARSTVSHQAIEQKPAWLLE